jgi:xylulokinase
VATVSDSPTADPTGIIAGFADATGRYLPLACTLNGAPVLDAMARLLGADHDELSRLALAAEPGSGGLVQVPYLEGERTPNLPDARGQLHGMTLTNLTRQNLARAAVEGLLGLLGAAMEGMRGQGVTIERVLLVGGGARSEAVRRISPAVWGLPVEVPESGEDVADGAARQASWVLSGAAEPPSWSYRASRTYTVDLIPELQIAYDLAAGQVATTASRQSG